MNRIFVNLKRIFQIWIVERIILKSQLDKGMLVASGPMYFQCLSAAVQLDLFTKLTQTGPQTRAEIANLLRLQNKPARILIAALVTTGFLKKKGRGTDAVYSNTLGSSIFLDRSRESNLATWIDFYHHVCYRPMFWMRQSLEENRNVGLKEYPGDEPTLYQRLARFPELENYLEKALAELSRSANSMLAEFVDLSNVRHLLDVGGGNATNVLALVRKYPKLRATVFDSPTVCGLAMDNIRSQGMEERCGVHPGDCFKNDFPSGVDAVLYSHFLDIWDEDQIRYLLKKAHDSLTPGGRVIILEIPQWENERGPHAAVSISPYFLALASGKGYMYTEEEYQKFLHEAGFVRIRSISLPQEHKAISGLKR